VAKDDLEKDLDQQDFLDFLVDFCDSNTTLPSRDSNSGLPLTRSDSNTSLPLSVVTEIFLDTLAQSPRSQKSVQSPRPPLLKRSSSGQWGSTNSLLTVDDVADIIKDVPTSPVHTTVDSEFEQQSPKPCDEISKPSTKKVCAAILKKSTKQNEKLPAKLSNKRKRKLKSLPSMMKKIASKRKRKSRGRSNKWSKEEDQRLRDAVNKFGKKKWNAVAAVVGTRTPNQCGQRWRKSLRPELANVNKGPWQNIEDLKLRKLVSSLGTRGTWGKIAKDMGYTRSPKQCRERWHNFLDPKLRIEWSDDEDSKLVSLFQQFGSQWANIAKQMSGRTGDRVKQRLHKIYNNKNEVLVY